NPFSIPTIPNDISTVPVQATAIDLLYDLNVDPSTLPTNAPPTSPSTLRIQATALTIMTGTTTSTAPYDDQFLDWLTQSDDLMCGVDPNLSGQSKKADINMLKSTEDLLGSIYKQQQQQQPTTLTTVQEVAQESTVSSPISIP
ncbi:unnamed protein product, partial [Adineta steineri]